MEYLLVLAPWVLGVIDSVKTTLGIALFFLLVVTIGVCAIASAEGEFNHFWEGFQKVIREFKAFWVMMLILLLALPSGTELKQMVGIGVGVYLSRTEIVNEKIAPETAEILNLSTEYLKAFIKNETVKLVGEDKDNRL